MQTLFLISFYQSDVQHVRLVAAQTAPEALRALRNAHPGASYVEVLHEIQQTEILNFALPERIRTMREAQQFYFRSRGAQQLAAAKALEKEVDNWLAKFGQEPQPKAPAHIQPNLF